LAFLLPREDTAMVCFKAHMTKLAMFEQVRAKRLTCYTIRTLRLQGGRANSRSESRLEHGYKNSHSTLPIQVTEVVSYLFRL